MTHPAGPRAGSPRSRSPAALAWTRIVGMMLRHIYVLRRSWPRLLELAYWPTMQMILWGFITVFFVEHSSWVARAAGVLVSAVLLWDVLFRGNLALSLSFLEEIWARNLGQIFASPLRPHAMVVSLLILSLARTLIGVSPAALLAIPLYDVSVFNLGPSLVVFFANLLVMGWCLGLIVSGLVLRFGLAAESLAWVVVFMLSPLSGVYYPITTLPDWLQPVSWALPSAYVFEGMRAILFDGVVRFDLLIRAAGLNVLYLSASSAFFLFMFHVARRRGLLLQQGE